MQRVFSVLLVIGCFTIVGSHAQQSQNVTFLGQFNNQYLFQSTGICVHGNYAYLTSTDGFNGELKIIDVYNPSSPSQTGSYSEYNFNPYCVGFSGNYAILGAGPDESLILDLSNLSSPQLITVYDNVIGDIHILGNTAYTSCGTEGLVILDISNLPAITELGYFEPPGSSSGIDIANNLAYLAWYDEGLKIVDATNNNNPTQIGGFDTQGIARDVFVSGNYAYIADESNGLVILDISNPGLPVEAGGYVHPTDYISIIDVAVEGNFAYLADWNFGLRIIDVTDKANPTEVGYYGDFYNIGWTEKVFVSGNIIYAAFRDGLFILRNDLVTSIEGNESLPLEFALLQNYPNPFNPSTIIRYQLPESGYVELNTYDLLGKEINRLKQEHSEAGSYEAEFSNQNIAGGVYIYRLTFKPDDRNKGIYSDSRKMILIK